MITQEKVESFIEKEVYWTTHDPEIFGENGQVTICVLKTKAGFECIGHSGTITPRKSFDLEVAKKIARQRALHDLAEKIAFFTVESGA